MAEGQVADVVGQDGSSSAGSATDAQSGQQGASSQQGTTTGQQSQQVATGTQPAQSGEFERQVKGLTGDLQKERRARQEYERQVTQIRGELESERRRVQALAGVTPSDPNAPQEEAVKAAFLKMFPQFGSLLQMSEEQLQALGMAPQFIQNSQQETQRLWERHGDQQMGYITEGVAQALGADSLDQDQQHDLRIGFTNWLQRTAQAELADTDGESSKTLDRYERGDKKLLDEFVTSYTKRWVEPARRASTAQFVNRNPRVPQTGARQPVSTVSKPKEFKSIDDRIAYAAELAKERGMVFGR